MVKNIFIQIAVEACLSEENKATKQNETKKKKTENILDFGHLLEWRAKFLSGWIERERIGIRYVIIVYPKNEDEEKNIYLL